MSHSSPIVIVGAPRSGTSLMQKLLREVSGFVSVPRESDMIWLPYCHPERNAWKSEGCPDSRITAEVIEDIRKAFSEQALTAATWRIFDRLGLMDKTGLSNCLRLAYRLLFKPWSQFRKQVRKPDSPPGRLVDKSVHAALWLNLVDAVFPNALYIHMVRAPDTCIPSMMHGWSMENRFRTYRIPDSVAKPRKDTYGWWSFPLPPDWETYYDKTLLEICAFQWRSINEHVVNSSSRSLSGRILRVHLEELVQHPDQTLDEICRFVHIDPTRLRPRNEALPKVNASRFTETIDNTVRDDIYELTYHSYDALKG